MYRQKHGQWIQNMLRVFRARVKNKESKLALLREYADYVAYERDKDDLKERRDKWNKRKGRKCFDLSNRPCFVCGLKSECRHHIIQLQNGGFNGKTNIVWLCKHCHSKVHPWMDKSGPAFKSNRQIEYELDAQFLAIVS